jgi:hypothetical protein
MRRPTTPDADVLARVEAIERALIVIGDLLQGLHVEAHRKLDEPLRDIRERHKPAASRLGSVRALIGM